ncbi:ornithine cyclodeaminase family protein [Chloroflexota bacterium]
MKVISAEDVRVALPMKDCIERMKTAFATLVQGKADIPLRTRITIPDQNAVSFFMPAYVENDHNNALTIKIVSLFPKNPEKGMDLIQAAVLVMDPDTGKPLALMEGNSLTAIRTGAASGAATDLLAKKECHVGAIFGAGIQGRYQLEAICAVRNLDSIWLYDIHRSKIDSLINQLDGVRNIPKDIQAADNPSQAIREADIICCATTSMNPVFNDEDLKAGVHINAIGSFTPEMQEVPSETICRSMVVVDSRSSTLVETGDLIIPIQQGLIREDQIHAELGEIILQEKPGRTSDDQITYFKSVGIAAQDALASQLVLKNSDILKLGRIVPF